MCLFSANLIHFDDSPPRFDDCILAVVHWCAMAHPHINSDLYKLILR